jgi:hypothetical protein
MRTWEDIAREVLQEPSVDRFYELIAEFKLALEENAEADDPLEIEPTLLDS